MPISTRQSGTTAWPSVCRISSATAGSAEAGQVPGEARRAPAARRGGSPCCARWCAASRQSVPVPSLPRWRSRARSSSTIAVSTVRIVSECRLTSVMWIASPASPNSAAAIGMPTWTVLPKIAGDRAHARRGGRHRAAAVAPLLRDVDADQQQQHRHEVREQRAPRQRAGLEPRGGAEQQRRHEDVERRVRQRARRVHRRPDRASAACRRPSRAARSRRSRASLERTSADMAGSISDG